MLVAGIEDTRGPLATSNSFRQYCGMDKNQFTTQLITKAKIQAYLAEALNFLEGKHVASTTGFLFRQVSLNWA
jgi:hypothetical protein